MPRRIDIELTSARSDGSWTWRKAGAQQPKGIVDATLLPEGAAVGDQLKVEAEQMLDGMEIISVVEGRAKPGREGLLELLPDDKPFEAVIETRAKRGRGDGPRSRDGDGERGRGRGRDGGRDGGRGRDNDRGAGGARDGDRDRSADRRERDGGSDGERRDRSDKSKKPHFEAPPEVPLRPKPKRLRPGKARRQAVLEAVPEEQRPIAELALQGMAAVRTRVKEENVKLKADGKPEMPEASITKMAEEMLPKLRVADWLDRAEAAQRQMQHLDLRDLRSVVAASADSMVARDESTREVADALKAALATKQTEEMGNWLEDVEAALTVGRVIRALRLSSQPPKAGVMFPPDLARRLGEAATISLLPDDSGDRWSAVLEAAAFSPVRALIAPTVAPTAIGEDLKKTVLRLGPLLPQIAALLEIEVPKGAKRPKPLRPTSRKEQKQARDAKGDDARSTGAGTGGDSRRDTREGGGRSDRNERGRSAERTGDDRRGTRPSKDRPKGMRDIATVMKAKEEAEKAAIAKAEEEAAAAQAAQAEAAQADADADAATTDVDDGHAATESGSGDASSDDLGEAVVSDETPADDAAPADDAPPVTD